MYSGSQALAFKHCTYHFLKKQYIHTKAVIFFKLIKNSFRAHTNMLQVSLNSTNNVLCPYLSLKASFNCKENRKVIITFSFLVVDLKASSF